MYRIKMICYNANKKVKPYEKTHCAHFNSRKDAEEAMLTFAKMECDDLNKEGNKNGNYFEVGEFEEVYASDGTAYPSFPISVLWYDKAPDDRENDCEIRVVTGYEVIEEIDVQKIKDTYKKGMRIRLVSMEDSCHPVPSGTFGTVDYVDDMGTIHMRWDTNSSLGLIPGVDEFCVVD